MLTPIAFNYNTNAICKELRVIIR